MFDYSYLKGRMAEKGISVSDLANTLGMTKVSLYSRFHGDIAFRDYEIVKVCEALDISDNDVNKFFFTAKVK